MTNNETWTSTTLWVCIEKSQDPKADAVRTMLKAIMPEVADLLAKGETSSNDFTLHDEGHAFRVAQAMTQIVPQDVIEGLSIYELMHLLLSAYLHDIGMTPEGKKVHEHYIFLLTGESEGLDVKAKEEFQDWLDRQDQDSNFSKGLSSSGKPTREQVEKAELLTTHYCRFKHNDWSAEWIRENLAQSAIDGYPGWQEDLILLCRSHHQTYEDLIGQNFKPHKIGQPFKIVHLRYLACVLRIADVLEFDPKRTPDVIFRHRNISEGSRIFWHKDRTISWEISSKEIKIYARPSSAYIHKALEDTMAQVNAELLVCKKIAEETHFSIPQVSQLVYRWDLPASFTPAIEPNQGTYEYIDGSFRPNTERLLKLLSGIELYKNPLAAVRELLQNAFDSVKERIAYERLQKPNPADPELEKILGKLRGVSLKFDANEDGDGFRLVCTDEGMGMTKAVLRDSFLVSGSSKRQDILALERKCYQAGIELGRTGHFGIGALSYFMLADRLTIRTKRSQEAGDADGKSWMFDIGGLNSFGELRVTNNVSAGTQVILDLRSDVVGAEPKAWFTKLVKYIDKTLLYIPCKLTLSSSLPGNEVRTFEAGWFKKSEDFDDEVLSILGNVDWQRFGLAEDEDIDVFTAETRDELDESQLQQDKTYAKAQDALKWHIKEGVFGNALGKYRIHIPYFNLEGNVALAYLDLEPKDGQDFMQYVKNTDFAHFPDWRMNIGWKGIKTLTVDKGGRLYNPGFPVNDFFSAVIEVDAYSSEVGMLSVDRQGLGLSDSFMRAIGDLYKEVERFYSEFLGDNLQSKFALLNHKLTGLALPQVEDMRWLKGIPALYDPGKSVAVWAAIPLPVLHYSRSVRGWGDEDNFLRNFDLAEWKWQGLQVTNFLNLSHIGRASGSWQTPQIVPERIIEFTHQNKIFLAALWTKESIKGGNSTYSLALGQKCLFPPEWRNLAVVRLERSGVGGHCAFLNTENPLVQYFDEERYNNKRSMFKQLDPLNSKSVILADRFSASTWLLTHLTKADNGLGEWRFKSMWEALPQRDKNFLPSLWKALEYGEQEPIYVWRGETQNGQLLEISPNVWQIHGVTEDIKKRLPEPSEEWRLIQRS